MLQYLLFHQIIDDSFLAMKTIFSLRGEHGTDPEKNIPLAGQPDFRAMTF